MSVVERIRQIQAEIQRKVAEGEATRVVLRQEELAAGELRRNFVNSQLEKIAKESGVVDMLQQIDKDLLNKPDITHGIVKRQCEGGFAEHSVGFKLIWCHPNPIYPDIHYKNAEEIERSGMYLSTYVEINPDTESITIIGGKVKRLTKGEWYDNRKLVEDSLAEAFLNPQSVTPSPDSSIN